MKALWRGTQLYVGRTERASFSMDEIQRAIRRAKEIADLDGLMIWTDADPDFFKTLCRTSRQCGIETYLWFPVLADVPGCSLHQDDLILNSEGKRGNGRIGVWEQLGKGDENFLFICPNNHRILDKVFRVYESLLNDLDIDGVMLDRIRYPSVVNGFESLFSCFCDFCQSKFRSEQGFSLTSLKQPIRDFFARLKGITLDELRDEWRSIDSLWERSGLMELSAFRKRAIFETVGRFGEFARSRNLKVGLDLFSISLSPIVSQDYEMLSGTCDWIKPMIYCHAMGPAGLPLEISSIRKALQVLNPGSRQSSG